MSKFSDNQAEKNISHEGTKTRRGEKEELSKIVVGPRLSLNEICKRIVNGKQNFVASCESRGLQTHRQRQAKLRGCVPSCESRRRSAVSDVILYTTEDGKTKIDLQLKDGTVWLSQLQIADLFQTSK